MSLPICGLRGGGAVVCTGGCVNQHGMTRQTGGRLVSSFRICFVLGWQRLAPVGELFFARPCLGVATADGPSSRAISKTADSATLQFATARK